MMIWSRSFEPNHGDVISMLYDMIVFTVCYCFPVSMCEAEVYVFELPDLTTFESRSVILGLLSSRFERTEVFVLFLMMSLCDIF